MQHIFFILRLQNQNYVTQKKNTLLFFKACNLLKNLISIPSSSSITESSSKIVDIA